MTGSYHNGSLFALVVAATNATVVNNANGISGVWESTGWTFTGTSLYEPNPTYVITANSPGMDVYGTITYQAVSAKLHLEHVARANIASEITSALYMRFERCRRYGDGLSRGVLGQCNS